MAGRRMTALAPPIWELAGASPQAIALEDHELWEGQRSKFAAPSR